MFKIFKSKIGGALPYLAVLVLFYIISYLFTPQVFRNQIVNQPDIASWRGMANEIVTHNNENPDDRALWTNSMFSGMPATSISVIYKGDLTDYLYRAIHSLTGVRPPSYLLITLIGGFLLFLAFGVDIWLAAIGAFAIAFCSYNMQIIQVGHNSKMVAIAFMPWVLAALVYTYRKRALLGSLLFALALSFEIKANHPQITYYLAIIVIGFAIAQLFVAIKSKMVPAFIKSSSMLLIAGSLGIATNINHLWPTYEYSKYTMRGGSQLAMEEGVNQKGLELSYATSWSYSPQETPNLMIPNFNGGSSMGELTTKSESYKVLKNSGYQSPNQIIKQLPLYWGPQPFTAGPMYMGAITLFLAILGLILIRGSYKWWIAGVSLIALLLSWGSNFLPLTKFFFDYIPLYNKFRTVSMILVVLQITLPLMAILILQQLLNLKSVGLQNNQPQPTKKIKQGFLIALGLTAGLSSLFLLFPSLAGSFTSAADGNLPVVLQKSLVADRVELLRMDALRSVAIISVVALSLYLFYTNKIKRTLFFATLSLLLFIDMWFVGKRYLNNSHFVNKYAFEQQYQKREVDKLILEDKDLSYRVLDFSVNTFNDSHVSFHHKTIGGYSPAKLQIYQDVIDRHITKEMQDFTRDIKEATTLEEAQNSLGYYPVLNMLNARYFVIDANTPPIVNKNSFGNCWFVSQIKEVNTLREELESLASVDSLYGVAIVNSNTIANTKGASNDPIDSNEVIILTSYSPNRLTYQYSAIHERVALFSEIYYPAGWRAYIDGEEIPIFKANYLLRALKLPAGSHYIDFEFNPTSFVKGERYSAISSTLLLLLLLLSLSFEFYKKNREKSIVE